MLNLAPPQLQFGRMMIFSDHADPNQFYFFPNFPHVAKTDEGKPAISLVVFKENLDELDPEAEDAVAFLSLDVDLSFTEDELKDARSFIRTELERLDDVKLSPVFFRRGTAKLLLLDAKTPEPGRETAPEAKTQFVEKMLGTASPSLFGDNRAIFQAMLTKKGAMALMGSIDGFAPIGIVYELTLAGLQPAYRVKIKADWSRVYHHFSEREHTEALWFYEQDIEKVVDDLVDKKVIEVDDVIEGVDEEGAKADHDAVMAELRRFVLEKLFTQTLKKEMPAGHDIGGEVANIANAIIAAPLSIFGGYSYVQKDLTESQLNSFEADWAVRKAVERTIFPQAHVSTLIREGGVTREELIKVVSGDQELFRIIDIDVSAQAAWDRDSVAMVSVDLEHGDPAGSPKTWSFILDKAAPRKKLRAWLDPAIGAKLRYRYEVVFSPEGVYGPEPKLSCPFRDHTGTVIAIRPDELYRMVDAEVSAVASFPFDRWPAVHTWIRLKDEGSQFEHVEDGLITAEKRKLTLRYRAPLAAEAPLEVRLRFVGNQGKVVETGWLPMQGTNYAFSDPQPSALSVLVVPAVDKAQTANLIVDFEYTDEAHGRFDTGQLVFDPTTLGKPQTWSIRLDDPTKRRYRYKLTLVKNDGQFLQTGFIETISPTLALGEVYVRRLDVEVSLFGKGPGVERVKVELAYHDAANDLHEAKSLTFGEGGATGTFQAMLKDASKQEFSYRVTWVMEDGFDRKLGPITTSDRFVVIPGSPPEDG